MCTKTSKENADCIAIADNYAIDPANFTRLSGNSQTASSAYKCKSCLWSWAGNFK